MYVTHWDNSDLQRHETRELRLCYAIYASCCIDNYDLDDLSAYEYVYATLHIYLYFPVRCF